MKRYVVLTCFLLLQSMLSPIFALELFWINTIGDWDKDTNWSLTSGGPTCNCLPGPSDTVHITTAGAIVTILDAVTAKASHVQIGQFSTLKVGKMEGSTGSLLLSEADVGLEVLGTAQIYGLVNIIKTPVAAISVSNTGTLDIKAGGHVDIQSAATGFINKGIINEGMLLLKTDLTYGDGKLSCTEVVRNAILNMEGGYVENKGFIQIDDMLDPLGEAILNEDTLVNLGQIHLGSMAGHGLNNSLGSYFENMGTLMIANFGATAIDNSGFFLNDGPLNIMDGTSSGISTHNVFINSGDIILSQIFSGFGTILANSEISNSGLIEISSCGSGITSFARFINTGDILISEINANALSLMISVTPDPGFDNQTAGYISIEGCSSGILVSEAPMRNAGRIEMRDFDFIGLNVSLEDTVGFMNENGILDIQSANANLTSLQISNSIVINDCNSTIKLDAKLVLHESGTDTTVFENQGFLFYNAPGVTSINSGTILNKGVIEDQSNSLEGVSRVINDGAILGTLYGTHVLGISSQGVIQGDLMGLNSDNVVYYESDLTVPGGTFDLASDTWIPGAPFGFQTIYHNISNGCVTNVIRQALENPVLFACPSPAMVNVKTGDGSWHDPFNWSLKQVPTFCQDVVLPNDLVHTLLTGHEGHAHLLEVQINGEFDMQGTLEVVGN